VALCEPWEARDRGPALRRNLIMWCRKDAASLLVQQKEIYRLIAGGPVARDFAAWAPLSRLPRLAGTGLDNDTGQSPIFPCRSPYGGDLGAPA
jgi:hypothetical protein